MATQISSFVVFQVLLTCDQSPFVSASRSTLLITVPTRHATRTGNTNLWMPIPWACYSEWCAAGCIYLKETTTLYAKEPQKKQSCR